MYLLTYQKNVTRLPDWMAGALDAAEIWFTENVLRRNVMIWSPMGWELRALADGALLASTREVCCHVTDATVWADCVLLAANMPRPESWEDRSDRKVIELVGTTDRASASALAR